MDLVKLAGILAWQIPTTVKGVRSFLGFGNFYRKFIEHYSEKSAPLHALTKKNQYFKWGTIETEAFETLKEAFMKEVVLTVPNNNAPYYMATDASKKSTGGVLMQRDSNGLLHPISFISATLNPAEQNYDIYDRELLALIQGLGEWRHYLEGSPFPVVTWVDHQNLTFF